MIRLSVHLDNPHLKLYRRTKKKNEVIHLLHQIFISMVEDPEICITKNRKSCVRLTNKNKISAFVCKFDVFDLELRPGRPSVEEKDARFEKENWERVLSSCCGEILALRWHPEHNQLCLPDFGGEVWKFLARWAWCCVPSFDASCLRRGGKNVIVKLL